MKSLQWLGTDKQTRRFYIIELDCIDDWPAEFDVESPHFVLFLACDAEKIGVDPLYDFAEKTIDQGIGYMCAWGPGCALVDDIFDQAHVMLTLNLPPAQNSGVLMTAWHDEESLEEALHFFFNHTRPDEDYAPQCQAWIAASIGSSDHANEIRRILTGWLAN